MFEDIKDLVGDLQRSYERRQEAPQAPEMLHAVRTAHDALVRQGLSLLVRSAAEFQTDGGMTSKWSDVGTAGAIAFLKAIELTRAYDVRQEVVGIIERSFLLILAALETYRCGRHGMAASILRQPDSMPPMGDALSPTLWVAQALHAFCRGGPDHVARASRECRMIRDRVDSWIKQDQQASADVQVFGLLSAVAFSNAILSLQRHLDDGTTAPMQACHTHMEDALHLARASCDAELLLFLQAFERATRALAELSIWRLRDVLWDGAELPNEATMWIRHRIRAGKAFLFPSQYEALLQTRAASVDKALVSMPTGGGKSLVAEVFALRSLLRQPEGKVFFVVPSRALASEKREEFYAGFGWEGSPWRVCQMTGEIAADSSQALDKHSIIVCTPEKFDVLLRTSFSDKLVAGLIVDEFHTIGTRYRGLKLQLAIARFVDRYAVPCLYISAIVRRDDFTALAEWAHAPQPFETDWKPTPARIGLVQLDRQPWVVSFNDGTRRTVPLESQILPTATTQASVRIVRSFLEEDQVLHFNLSYRGYSKRDNQLFRLANDYIELRPQMSYLDRAKLKVHADRLARLIGWSHPVCRAFREGIAVHWGELPHPLRKIVEQAVRDKAIGLVLATATLAEGVNLPFRTVYVPKLRTRQRPLEMGTFLNVVGRAGRPYFHPEGQIIVAFCETGDDLARTTQSDAKDYAGLDRGRLGRLVTGLAYPADLLTKIISQGLWQDGEPEPLPGWEGQLQDETDKEDLYRDDVRELLAEIENASSCLLAAIAEGIIGRLVDDTKLSAMIFLGTETEEQRSQVRRLFVVIERRLMLYGAVAAGESGTLHVTPWGQAVCQAGLGPESCVKLRAHLRTILPQFRGKAVRWAQVAAAIGPRTAARALFDELFELLRMPREFFRTARTQFDATDAFLLRGWVSGVMIEDIAEAHQIGGDFLLAYMRIDGLLSSYASWVFYAAHLIVEHDTPDEPLLPALKTLSDAASYGHHHPDMLDLLRRDVNRELLRDDAITLSRALSQDELRRLLEGGMGVDEVVAALSRPKIEKTRLPQQEVAEAAIRAALRQRGPTS